jgi:hypothetical protein
MCFSMLLRKFQSSIKVKCEKDVEAPKMTLKYLAGVIAKTLKMFSNIVCKVY